ncbi:hypothetical protein B0T16DRAFT_427047 [Cercophora newfieldiana]|uniref:HNH nuclease domain-containing protein n=1 Tax=Cercophora newfieldiana TaxID=92897 RepID=A0AA40CVY3_9PEZI|nr:hypothetical protein B0T16DRAFT_427047 [Cercophora newfieldiana]
MSREGGRALARDVFIYDLDTLLGGLVLTAGVTNANFYAMVDIIIDISPPGPFFLQDESGETIAQDAQPLLPGVRKRDVRYVVTKQENPRAQADLWGGFEAAHIFPLAYQHQWDMQGWGQQITIFPSIRPFGTINSVQNGLLLRNDIHCEFDLYYFSINPDDGYKIIYFQPEGNGIAGTFLDACLLNDRRRPLETLLRWHFRQAVLTNMKGAGEPIFEHDFPPGSDMMGEIQSGPKAAERMKFELFNRLANHMLAGVDTDEEDKDEEDRDEDQHDSNVEDKG